MYLNYVNIYRQLPFIDDNSIASQVTLEEDDIAQQGLGRDSGSLEQFEHDSIAQQGFDQESLVPPSVLSA